MNKTIYISNTWHVSRADALVHFKRMSRSGRTVLLDRTARWTGDGWDSQQWLPTSADVPDAVMLRVVAALIQQDLQA